jgi:hypothetical protein
MASPMLGHIQLELEALYKLSQELVNGDAVDVDYSFDMEVDNQEICVIQIQRGCSTYLLTSESSEKGRDLVLRSTEIPELLISLPSPVYFAVAEPAEIGDFC